MMLWIVLPVDAQIIEHSLQSNPHLKQSHSVHIEVRSDKPLTLPFVDDFSQATGYPDSRYWEDNQAYINHTLGLNPPSIGVATLDGLNAEGLPYGGGYGGSDTLTSRRIDLSKENSPYLSFFIQPKGIGYIPQVKDSLIVEGKNKDGEWKKLESFEGLDNSYINKDAPAFQRVSILLSTDFLHAEFQFRFRNYSNNRGLESLWHLDYVMVTREAQDLYINDIAFTSAPAFLITRYSAYPLAQIKNDLTRLNNKLPIHLRNNSRDRLTIDTSRAEIYDTETNHTIFTDESLLEIPPIVPENQRNINPGPAFFTNTFNLKNLSSYLTQTNLEQAILATEYEYVMRAEAQLPAFKNNNRVVRKTHFDNYLAYDDHSVEGSISTYNGNGIKTRIAVEYDLVMSDSLHSIRILFPYLIEDYEHKQFNLLIFIGELKENADFTLYNLQPKRGNQYQPFTEYIIKDHIPEGIELPAGKFYIGWEHPRGTSTDYIPFGFDKNYPDANQYMYYNVGGDWLNVATSSPDIEGAIAMRAVVRRNDLLTGTGGRIDDISQEVYPNPATSKLYLRSGIAHLEADYHIYGLTGQLFQSGTIYPGKSTLDINRLQPGSYFILLTKKDKTIVGNIRFIKQ